MGLKLFISYLTIINVIGFLSMGLDKRKARKQTWRIPEATLLLIAAMGGAAGSYFGMEAFRHKTKHRKFMIGVPLLLALQIAGVIYLNSMYHFLK